MPRPNQLPLDYFDGAGNVSDREGLLRVLRELDDAIAAAPRSSGVEGVIHQLYADGENGSDAWAGDTPSTPKRTLGALGALLPDFIRDSVTLNIRNKFTLDQGSVPTIGAVGFYVGNQVATTGRVMLDGGSEVDEVAGPWVADIYAVDRIGRASLTMTPDQYAGRWLEVVDGPMAGRRVAVQENDATTFYPVKAWSLDPGPATFRLVEPHTEIYGVPGLPSDYAVLGTAGTIRFMVQRLKITGEAYIAAGRSGSLGLGQVVINATKHLLVWNVSEVYMTGAGYHPATGAVLTGDEAGFARAGLSVLAPSSLMTIANVGLSGLFNSVFRCDLLLDACVLDNYLMWHGTKILGKLSVRNSLPRGPLVSGYAEAGYRKCKISNPAGVGLELISSGRAYMDGALDISDCGSHAIVVDDSSFLINAAGLAGSGNVGAGLHAPNGGKVSFSTGSTPTVTGTVGDVSLDGTTEASTWAAIAAGTPINGATPGNVEFAVVKKV